MIFFLIKTDEIITKVKYIPLYPYHAMIHQNQKERTLNFRSTENLTLLGIILGILFGLYLPEFALKQQIIGEVFLTLLKMLIMPLILASVIIAVMGLGSIEKLKRMGLRVIAYYMSTTALAVLMGLIIVNIIDPGDSAPMPSEVIHTKELTISGLILSLFPSNVFASLSEGKVLQVIFFAIMFGVASLYIVKEKRELMHNFFEGVNDTMLVIANWIVKLTPVGVFSILSYMVAKEGVDKILSLWEYALTVVLALLLHAILTLPAIAYFIGKFNPLEYFKNVREAVLLAFSTASSAATLSVSIKKAETSGGVRKDTAGFILPLGATVNMDGTALYESIAVMYIANLAGVDLTFSEQILIFITATLASVGAAGVPGAGLVMMTIVLGAVGLPVEYIGIIIVIDRFLDMVRTAINVWGDLLGAKVIDRIID
jgi:proton glutamate symport protein